MAATLDRRGQGTLVVRAGTRLAARLDLAALGDVAAQAADILVVDHTQLVDAELADLAAPEPAPLDGLACWRNG